LFPPPPPPHTYTHTQSPTWRQYTHTHTHTHRREGGREGGTNGHPGGDAIRELMQVEAGVEVEAFLLFVRPWCLGAMRR
jgi:hypothetical protein